MSLPPATAAMAERLAEGAALVVAHPDDEILWFSSILRYVGRVVVCFSQIPSSDAQSRGRKEVVLQLPLQNLRSLDLAESEVFNAADWPDPEPTEVGLAVRIREHSPPGFSRQRYVENFQRLRESLKIELAGCTSVFTHSPWGEYGHEEHVQVFRVVESLREEMGYRIYFPNYVSDRSLGLFRRYAPSLTSAALVGHTATELAAVFKALYIRHGCWTWYDDYQWPAEEAFFEWQGPGVVGAPGVLAPLNFVHVSQAIPAWRPRSLVRNGWARMRRLCKEAWSRLAR
jgi:hypothetical protein